MSVNRLKQNILHVHEVYGLRKWFMIIYLANLKQPPSHPIWIEHLTKKSNFRPFLGLQTPPPPPLTEGMVEVCSREAAAFKNISGSVEDIVQQHFFTTYCKEYQLFTQTKNWIIIANVKTLYRFYCKECESLTAFSFAFQARVLQFLFFK